MTRWPDRRIIDLFGIELPIIRASLAGATTVDMVAAAAKAGGRGSLPSALLKVKGLSKGSGEVRAATKAPVNLNFFARLALL
jgi:nitronate monooxygenase